MTVKPQLLERLRELALVDLDTLLGRLPDDQMVAVLAAYVADLEDALGAARATIRDAHRDLGAGPDPLALLDLGPERRARAAESDAGARLAGRAAARRELARLEELVVGVLPRLLEADRRYAAVVVR
jgi:hypothetical protein